MCQNYIFLGKNAPRSQSEVEEPDRSQESASQNLIQSKLVYSAAASMQATPDPTKSIKPGSEFNFLKKKNCQQEEENLQIFFTASCPPLKFEISKKNLLNFLIIFFRIEMPLRSLQGVKLRVRN